MQRPKKITIKEIASLAGVSTMTVSRVVNGFKGINPETRSRVQEVIDANNYHPSSVAQRMSGKISRSLCFVAEQDTLKKSRHTVTFDSEMWRLLIAEGCLHNYRIIVTASTPEYNRKPEYIKMAEERSIFGLVVLDLFENDPRIRKFQELNIPTILLGRTTCPSGNFYAVSTDDCEGGFRATEYLIKQGRKRIAFLSFPGQFGPAAERLQGFRKAHEHYDQDVDEALVCINQRLNEEVSGYDGMKQLLSSDSPDAVFCTSDLRAFGAIRAIQEAGLTVNDDIAVMGYDDMVYAKGGNFPLTTIRQPFESMIMRTIELFNLLEENKTPEKKVHLFDGELVIRKSA